MNNSTFNPGRLRNVERYIAPQPVIPGSGQYDYVSSHKGTKWPHAVGNYPSASPGAVTGLAGDLSDDASSPISPAMALFIMGAAALGVYWLNVHKPSGWKL